MYCTKSSIKKIEDRGNNNGHCAVCGEQLLISAIGRSIWFDGFTGGGGEVRQIGEVYCPKCDSEPKLPPAGTPIYESEIMEVRTG